MAGSRSLDKWRDYFRSADSDIFGIIENAIVVAASDCPYEFKSRRDRIAEVLFACKITKCSGCDRLELAVPNAGAGGEGLGKSEDKCRSGVEAGGSKESKVNSSSRDDNGDDDRREVAVAETNVANRVSDDCEALNDEIEEESQFYEEVLRIKGVLDNHAEETDAMLFDSLRRLQLMPFSVETLKATGIGKSVNAIRKHRTKEIRNLVRTLIEDWKVMVDSWVDATKAIAASEIRTESDKTSVVEDEEGLPSPPLDEGAFFATPTSMELSQFFDGMDDDGNPRSCGEQNKNRRSVAVKPTSIEKTDAQELKNVCPNEPRAPPMDRMAEAKRYPEAVLKRQAPPTRNCPPSGERVTGAPKPSNYESGLGRPKPSVRPTVQQSLDKGAVQKKSMPSQQEKLNPNETSIRMNLEVAKRKLQERYQEAENAKRQRTIQVVELVDLPKQSVGPKNQQKRPGNGNHNRNWANGRR